MRCAIVAKRMNERSKRRSNPYDRCPETHLPLRAAFCFFSAFQGRGVVVPRWRALTCFLDLGADSDGCTNHVVRCHHHRRDEGRAAWRFFSAPAKYWHVLIPSASTAWMRGCAAPVRAGLGGGAAPVTWAAQHRRCQSQSACPITGAGLRETGARPTLACTDAGPSDPRPAPVRRIPLTSSSASGARALLPQDGRHRSLAKATWRLRLSSTARPR